MGSDLVVQLVPEIRHRGCGGIELNCAGPGWLASSWPASSSCRRSLTGKPDVFIGFQGSRTPNIDLWENRTPKQMNLVTAGIHWLHWRVHHVVRVHHWRTQDVHAQ